MLCVDKSIEESFHSRTQNTVHIFARMGDEKETVPTDYQCPITKDLFCDPVVAADGHTYERAALVEWLKSNDKSPMTNEVLPHKHVLPNILARKLARSWAEQNGVSIPRWEPPPTVAPAPTATLVMRITALSDDVLNDTQDDVFVRVIQTMLGYDPATQPVPRPQARSAEDTPPATRRRVDPTENPNSTIQRIGHTLPFNYRSRFTAAYSHVDDPQEEGSTRP